MDRSTGHPGNSWPGPGRSSPCSSVLALGLRYAEMSIITLGWIVVLQAAVIVVDRSRYGTTITTGDGWR